jgi:FemAB family protein
MLEKLKNLITQSLDKKCKLDCSDWSRVLDDSSYVSIFHLKNTVNYYVSYYKGEDISFVVYQSERAVAVFPLFVYKNHDNWVLTSNGVELIEPVFIDTINDKTKKKIEKKVLELFIEISRYLNIYTLNITNINHNDISNWYLLWLDMVSKTFITYHLFVDLSLSLEEIKVNFSKSHKNLINKSLKKWKTNIYNNIDNEVFSKFRLLHKEVSGRETRTIETWDIQQKTINQGEAFLITVLDSDIMIGSGLFTFSRDSGIYSVSASKRELFDSPIGHGMQMKAIEALKEKGCKWYEVGQRHYKNDEIKPTEKELSISHFKEGFATHRTIRPHLIVDIK